MPYRTFAIATVLFVFAFAHHAQAQYGAGFGTYNQPLDLGGLEEDSLVRLGASEMVLHPFVENGYGERMKSDDASYGFMLPRLDLSIGSRFIKFELGIVNIVWGATKFPVDVALLSAWGARIYPFGEYFSAFGNMRFGSSMFTNITFMLEAGIDADIPFKKNKEWREYVTYGISTFAYLIAYGVENNKAATGFTLRAGFLFRLL